jgi:hypothetical protein
MLKVAKDLNKVIKSLEDSGKYVEAKSLHNVFMKVAQFEFMMPGVAIGQAVGNALAPAAQGLVSNAIGGIQNAFGGAQKAIGGAIQGAAQGAGNVMNNVGSYGASLQGKNNANVSANYQALVEEYKNRFVNELKSTNNPATPNTSQFFNSVMQGNMLTEFEKQAFRAQAFRIREEAKMSMGGGAGGGNFNLPLMIENLVKNSGVMNIRDPQQLENSKTQLFNTIFKQIQQNVPEQQQQQYLQSANNILSSYLNNRSVTLNKNQQLPSGPQAQPSPTISPM